MLDHNGNPVSLYEKKKFTTTGFLRENKMIVICCDARHSRSNDTALDVLVDKFGMNFYDTWKFKEKYYFNVNYTKPYFSTEMIFYHS